MRVLRLASNCQLGVPEMADKRLPDCEGIETIASAMITTTSVTDKRLPDCEGIETQGWRLSLLALRNRQEAARL